MASNKYMEESIPQTGVIDENTLREIAGNELTQAARAQIFKSPGRVQVNPNLGRIDRRYSPRIQDVSFRDPEEINEKLADQQSGFNHIWRGLGSMGAIAGTTLLDATIGNLAQGISMLAGTNEGPTNKVSEVFRGWQNNRLENKPIYKEHSYDDKSLLAQLATTEFWGEFLQNQGFTLGMMGASALTSFIPYVGPMLATTMSAISEARTEAMGLKDEMSDELYTQIVSKYDEERLKAKTPEEAQIAKDNLNESLAAAYSDIDAATKYANRTNIALLTATNLITWGSILNRGYKAVKNARLIKKAASPKEEIKRQAKESFDKILKKKLKENAKIASRGTAVQGTIDTAKMLGKMSSEFMEEYTQSAIQKATDYIPSMNTFASTPYYSGEEKEEVSNGIEALGKAMLELTGDKETLRQGIMGALGATATLTFKAPKTNGKWNIPIGFDGAIPEYIENLKNNQRVANQLSLVENSSASGKINKIINDFTRTSYYNTRKEEAADANDAFNYKNYSLSELMSIVMAADDVGKLDIVTKALDEASKISDDEWLGIAKSLSEDSGETKFFTKDELTGDETVDKEAVKSKVDENIAKLRELIDLYVDQKHKLMTSGREFSDEAMKNYIYGYAQRKDWLDRRSELYREVSNTLEEAANKENVEESRVPTSDLGSNDTGSIAGLVSTKNGRESIRKHIDKYIPLDQQKEQVLQSLNDLDKIEEGISSFTDELNNYWNYSKEESEALMAMSIDGMNASIDGYYQQELNQALDRSKIDSLESFVAFMDRNISEGARILTADGTLYLPEEYDQYKDYLAAYSKIDSFREKALSASRRLNIPNGRSTVSTVLSGISEYKNVDEYLSKAKDSLEKSLNAIDKDAYDSLIQDIEDQENAESVSDSINKDARVIKSLGETLPEDDPLNSELMNVDEDIIDKIIEDLINSGDLDEEEIATKKTRDSKALFIATKVKYDTYKPLLDKYSKSDESDDSEEEKSSGNTAKKPEGNPKENKPTEDNKPVKNGSIDNSIGKDKKLNSGSEEDINTNNPTSNEWSVGRSMPKYSISKAKNKTLVKESYKKDTIDYYVRQLLDEYEADEFIQNGELYKWYLNRYRDKKPYTIRLLVYERKGLKPVILAGVEMSGRDGYSKGKILEVTDSDGNRKDIQILGVLGSKDESYKGLYESLVNRQGKKTNLRGNNETIYLSDVTTNLLKIYTGRMIISSDTKSNMERSLKGILDGEDPKSYGLMVVIDGDIKWLSDTKFNSTLVKNNNFSDTNGMAYIVSVEADGMAYPKQVAPVTMSKAWWDANSESPFAEKIIEAVTKIVRGVASNNTELRNSGISELHNYIYISPDNKFIADRNGVKLENSDLHQIDYGSEEAAVRDIIEFLNSQSLHFSVGSGDISMDGIIESNVLYTNLLQLHNVIPSLKVAKLEKTDNGYVSTESTEELDIKIPESTRPIEQLTNSGSVNTSFSIRSKTGSRSKNVSEAHMYYDKAMDHFYTENESTHIRTYVTDPTTINIGKTILGLLNNTIRFNPEDIFYVGLPKKEGNIKKYQVGKLNIGGKIYYVSISSIFSKTGQNKIILYDGDTRVYSQEEIDRSIELNKNINKDGSISIDILKNISKKDEFDESSKPSPKTPESIDNKKSSDRPLVPNPLILSDRTKMTPMRTIIISIDKAGFFEQFNSLYRKLKKTYFDGDKDVTINNIFEKLSEKDDNLKGIVDSVMSSLKSNDFEGAMERIKSLLNCGK